MSLHGSVGIAERPKQFENPEFQRQRTRNWMALGLLYAFFYMTRYNFAAVMKNLSDLFGWKNTQLGVFETVMPLVYGLSVVFNGPIADRIGGRRAFLIGAAGVTVMNFLFGFMIHSFQDPSHGGWTAGTILPVMAMIWGLNGYFQSFGALSIVKVNAQWFHVRERGTFSGIFGVLIRLGLILAFSGVPLIVSTLPLSFGFWLPAALVMSLFLVNFLFMRNSPRDAGFIEIDTGDGDGVDDGRPADLGFVIKRVFANRVTWNLAFASMMLGIVRRSTVDSWFPKYFTEIFLSGNSKALATSLPYQFTVYGIAVLGIAGGFAFGIASDRIYNGRRGPVITWGFLGMTTVLLLFGLADRTHFSPWIATACLALLSFFVNGSHGIIMGAAAMDFAGRKAVGTATGLLDGMQYLASSFVGIGMGYTLDHWGWSAWQWMPIPFAMAGVLLVLPLWNATPGKKSGAAQSTPKLAAKPLVN